MILELIFDVFFGLIYFLMNLLPSLPVQSVVDISAFINLLKTGLYFFGTNSFYLAIGSLIFWLGIDLGWGVIEWLYKKIPGVD